MWQPWSIALVIRWTVSKGCVMVERPSTKLRCTDKPPWGGNYHIKKIGMFFGNSWKLRTAKKYQDAVLCLWFQIGTNSTTTYYLLSHVFSSINWRYRKGCSYGKFVAEHIKRYQNRFLKGTVSILVFLNWSPPPWINITSDEHGEAMKYAVLKNFGDKTQ